ncbi:MAG: hypothetical protein ACLFVR_11390 [Thiohalospira sp.]
MKQRYLLALGMTAMVLIIGCKSSEEKQSETSKEEKKEAIVVKDTLNEVIYVLPSPNEMLDEIFIEKININSSFINPYSNAEKYLDTRSQAINLGVYIADFAYLSNSTESTTELEYLKVIKKLSEEVNIHGLMGNKTIERIQNNLNERDTLKKISQELYYKISNTLENSNRENIFTLIATGAIIESLYLSVMIVDDFEDYIEIIGKMYEQKFVFDNFYEYATVYKDDPYVRSTLVQLDVLKETFEEIEQNVEEATELESNDDNTLRFTGGSKFIVDKENFKFFKSNIKSIREEIIMPKN